MPDLHPDSCICWSGPAVLHEGHCCFAGPDDQYRPGHVPCGHNNTEENR